MFRHRAYQQVVYGRFNEFFQIWQELGAISRKRGWPEPNVWVPTVGTANEVIVEVEFRNLAEFQSWNEAFESDADAMKLLRARGAMVVQGSVHDELLEKVSKPLA
jgi:heme-degrading monooxygenase HmoA